MPPNVTWNPVVLNVPAPKPATVATAPGGSIPCVPFTVSMTAPVTPEAFVTETGSTSVPWWAPPNVSV